MVKVLRTTSRTLPHQLARVTLADVIQAMRDARDLMNHNGRHWIQGAERANIRDSDFNLVYEEIEGKRKVAVGFCSIGGLKEAIPTGIDFAYYIALIELARDISPEDFDSYVHDVLENYMDWKPTQAKWDKISESVLVIALGEECENIVINFNDDEGTTWPMVRSRFTRTADRLRKRKAIPAYKQLFEAEAQARIAEYAEELALRAA